ncbi:site-specific integrase [Peribacillus frigoritolerans]|uniref:tyrosine-type recombinase/integrase n=1 Tax=Peribacillus frigoritolerans TaxID=450367 RepID=UPI002B253C79|nr:site-specific integrase [Peribacillus frigoritolerans]MEB2494314.1 site-specific integrase [Peribacillus frigoritolerans]
MSDKFYYDHLRNIDNTLDNNDRLRAFVQIYSSAKINGQHYVHFDGKENLIQIYTPSHKLHYYSSCFLLKQKYTDTPINTVSRQAQQLRRFLDFLEFWNIDLLQVDTFTVVVSFVSYLRLLKSLRATPNRAIEWSLLKQLPLHERAKHFGKVSSIGLNLEGIMVKDRFEDFSYNTISGFVETACNYLVFLKKETHELADIDLTSIPVKQRAITTTISGTTGRKTKVMVTNVHAILSEASFSLPNASSDLIQPLSEEVMTEEDVNNFMSLIPSEDIQTRLLFYILKSFGIRRAEARNLLFVSKNLPKDFYLWDINKAQEWVKNEMECDLSYDNTLKAWVCAVVKREVSNFQSQNKTVRPRLIPNYFSQQELTNLLLEHIKERQLVMEETRQEHDYLFYSTSNNSKGEAITGGTIYARYRSVISGSEKVDFYLRFSPHSFRHFFATHLIRIKRKLIYDVSRWLGHRDEKTTRTIYLHYLPGLDNLPSDNKVGDMAATFKNGGKE